MSSIHRITIFLFIYLHSSISFASSICQSLSDSFVSEYGDIYDLVEFLPFYKKALAIHMQWVRLVPGRGPVIVDLGGGTGNMSIAAQTARPDAKVLLVDNSMKMIDYAIHKGFPRSQTSLSDVRNIHLNGQFATAGFADHVFSHSVIWNLESPDSMFIEVNRVLRPNGTFALSTGKRPNSIEAQGFIEYLHVHLEAAVQRGEISKSEKSEFIYWNSKAGEAKSPLTKEQVVQMGEKYGFQAIDIRDAYEYETTAGRTALFSQVLFRKTREIFNEEPLRLASPEDFARSIAKTSQSHLVNIKSSDEFQSFSAAGGRIYLSADAKVGFALDNNGELSSLFNNSGEKLRGANAVKQAIALGAKSLYCIDSYLPSYYETMGFVIGERLPFDEKLYFGKWPKNQTRPRYLYHMTLPLQLGGSLQR